MGTIFHGAVKYRVVWKNARSSEIKEYDGGDTGANARTANKISNFRQYPQQTITLAIFDNMFQCVHIFSKEPPCNKETLMLLCYLL